MIRIAFDFRRSSFVTLHQYADRIRAKRHRRRKKVWPPQNHAIRLFHVRAKVRLIRQSAARQSRQGQRSTHQFQKVAAIHRVVPLGSMSREFAVQQISKMRIVRQFLQRPPVLFAAFFPQLFSNRGKIQLALADCAVFRLAFVVAFMTALCPAILCGLYDAKLLVVCVIAHIVRYR